MKATRPTTMQKAPSEEEVVEARPTPTAAKARRTLPARRAQQESWPMSRARRVRRRKTLKATCGGVLSDADAGGERAGREVSEETTAPLTAEARARRTEPTVRCEAAGRRRQARSTAPRTRRGHRREMKPR